MKLLQLNRKHEMFLNSSVNFAFSASDILNRKHEMFLNSTPTPCMLLLAS